ncbi:MAG: hypothetical protein ACLQGU_12180 [bacterium]
MKHRNFLKVRELPVRKSLFIMLVMGILAIAVAVPAIAQMTSDRVAPGSKAPEGVGLKSVSPYVAPPDVLVPDCSKEAPEDVGVRMHTNYLIYNPSRIQPKALRDLSQPEPEEIPEPNIAMKIVYETPTSLACVYGMGKISYKGCRPMISKPYNATGGGRAIAIVIAYDNPTVLADLQYFSTYFKLPAPNFTKVIANGNGSCSTPPYDEGWAVESALDTQWAHAMAPSAAIVLVEACSNLTADLMYAETVASTYLLLNYGGGQVSNSWSGAEWSGQTAYDDYFPANGYYSGNNVSYFFSAGDAGYGAQYPSSSPWVVSAGGTTINRDPKTKAFVSESCWSGSGGGISAYETWQTSWVGGYGMGPWANYQYPIFGSASRMTPDMSFNADPNISPVYVTYSGVWYLVGGTSVSAPALAGIVNNSNNQLGVAVEFPVNPLGYYNNAENNLLYSQLQTYKEYMTNFYDVTTGSNGAPALPLWDYCTGVGSPRGKLGK